MVKKPSFDSIIIMALVCLCSYAIYLAYSNEPDLEYKPPPEATVNRKYPPKLIKNDVLEQMVQQLVYNGKPFILDFKIENGFCELNINPSIWNSFTLSEQKQIGDFLASSGAWQNRIINARLYVHRTEVGRVKPKLSGGHEFILYKISK
jgi:hypothetical protein